MIAFKTFGTRTHKCFQDKTMNSVVLPGYTDLPISTGGIAPERPMSLMHPAMWQVDTSVLTYTYVQIWMAFYSHLLPSRAISMRMRWARISFNKAFVLQKSLV